MQALAHIIEPVTRGRTREEVEPLVWEGKGSGTEKRTPPETKTPISPAMSGQAAKIK